MNNVHIVPVDDLYKHEENELCGCSPEIIKVLGSTMYVHHSYDGRERTVGKLNLRLTKEQLN